MTDMIPFQRTGLLALEPSALGECFALWFAPPQPFELVGDTAIVDVKGPLSYDGYGTDTYGGIRARFTAALASDAKRVVVRFNSPGGDVSGAFDLARALPQLAKAANKPYIAFTETVCASAAYALASGADRIVASDTAKLGSIGVIAVYAEQSKADAAMGLKFEIFASGDRKADGNPHQPWSAAARANMQRGINEAAGLFFDLVIANRGIKAPGNLEGACFMGAAARGQRLCDKVQSWDELLAELGATAATPACGLQQGATQAAITAESAATSMPDDKDDKDDKKAWRKALKAAADGGDEDAKKAFKSAFPDDKDGDKEDDKKDDKDKKDAKAKAEMAVAAPAVAASADPLVAGLMAQVQAQGAQLAAIAKAAEDAERATFMATRPDLTKELVAALATKPLAEVKAIVAAIPAAGNPLAPPTLAAAVPRGNGPLAASPNADMDRRMGIMPTGTKLGVVETDNLQIFGVPVAAGVTK